MKKPSAGDLVRQAASAMGRKGGRSKSSKKLSAIAVNSKRLRSPAGKRALEIARQYGTVRGERHKAWVIDQMVRSLTGDFYQEWVSRLEVWDCGLKPNGAT